MMRIGAMGLAFALLLPVQCDSASAFSPEQFPSFKLNVLNYDVTIFYKARPFDGKLWTQIGIDQRYETRVDASLAAGIQRRADRAREIELVYNLASAGGRKIDLLAAIPTAKSFSVGVFIYLQQTPFAGEIGNLDILSNIERLSAAADSDGFDSHGYQLISKPTPIYVMRRDRYTRPNGRPLFFLRRPISPRERIYTLEGAYLVEPRVRVLYGFRTDQVGEEHWVDVDEAVHKFVATILTPR